MIRATLALLLLLAGPSRPEALIKELYQKHDSDQSPFYQTEDRDRVDHFFEKSLADLIWNDVVSSDGEVGALDFDPLYDAQDTEITNFKIGTAVIKGQHAQVPVTFENFGENVRIVYALEKQNGAWKITDITWSKGRSLRALLTDAASG